MDVEEKARLNTEKFKLHGADHLGEKISNQEPRVYRGAGGVLNAAMSKPQHDRYSMVDRSDSTVGV
jgi:hypothetical protein